MHFAFVVIIVVVVFVVENAESLEMLCARENRMSDRILHTFL